MAEGRSLEGRSPTSHEQSSGQHWDASYQGQTAPWDIGKPQPAIARLASRIQASGPMLDAGCGTGENTLLFASLGVPILGVEVAETALEMARRKAAERGIAAEFVAADALHLDRLKRQFATVLDCGLFHSFEDTEQQEYAASLAAVTKSGSKLYILCFSSEGPDPGPHPVSQQDLTAAFHSDSGWKIEAIEPERIETTMHDNGVSAWLVTARRT